MRTKTTSRSSNSLARSPRQTRARGVEVHGVPLLPVHSRVAAEPIPGTGAEAGPAVIDKCLSRIFVAAYLLTGSARRAETAVSESIRQLDVDATRGGWLSWNAVAAAITQEDADPRQAPDEAPAALPVELLRVLQLPLHLRQCFVLRVLMAMPRHRCGSLLRIDAEQVDAYSSLAAQELAAPVAKGDGPMGAAAAQGSFMGGPEAMLEEERLW
jgi:hypothetical protein